MILREFETREDAFQTLSDEVSLRLKNAIVGRGFASVAVPGGTTPTPLFERLRAEPLDWSKVTVMLGDERYVPETSERSNTKLLKEKFLLEKASLANYQPFYLDGVDVRGAANQLAPEFDNLIPLDVCVLGMGADMHTASLFPNTPELEAALAPDAPTVMAIGADEDEPRITLTARALDVSKYIAVLIVGEAKRDALDQALGAENAKIAPIKHFLSDELQTEVFYAP